MKLFPKIVFLACLLLSVGMATAQTLDWAHSFGSSGPDIGFSVVADSAGNVYSAGAFSGNVDFDPGPGTYNMYGDGFLDAYVTKMDAAGNLLWAVEMGAQGNDQALDMAIDAQGNVYVAGAVEGTVDFDPGPGVYTVASGSTSGAPYVWKLDSNGNLVWAVVFTGHGGIGFHLALDTMGNVAIAGYFTGTVNFGPVTYSAIGFSWDIFVAKISNAGTVMWAKQLGSSDFDDAYGVAMDANSNVYFGGGFQNTLDFDPGPGVANVTANSTYSAYLCKFDSLGDFVWVRDINPIGGAADVFVVACNAQGDVFASGYFDGAIDFDPGAGTLPLVSTGSRSAFIARWDAAGNIVWADGILGDSLITVQGLQLDAQDNVYFAGFFNGTADFDPGAGVANFTSQLKDIFVGKLDAAGNFAFAHQFGGSGNDRGYDFSGRDGHTYAIGRFEGTVDFDPGSAVHNLVSNGLADIVIQKFTVCRATDSTWTVSACDSFVAPSGAVYQSSGTYVDVIPNAAGCDSVITLQLTLQPTQASLSQLGNALTASPAGASYQWANCENGWVNIPGATQQSYTPSLSGNYAVIVTANGCVDTSACTLVTIVGLEDHLPSAVSLSPNPAGQSIFLRLPADCTPQYFEIYDLTGRLHMAGWLDDPANCIDISRLAAGIYALALNGPAKARLRFVKA